MEARTKLFNCLNLHEKFRSHGRVLYWCRLWHYCRGGSHDIADRSTSFDLYVAQPLLKFSIYPRKGCPKLIFVCGHAQQNVEAMCACKPDNISIDEIYRLILSGISHWKITSVLAATWNLPLSCLWNSPWCSAQCLECIDMAEKKDLFWRRAVICPWIHLLKTCRP